MDGAGLNPSKTLEMWGKADTLVLKPKIRRKKAGFGGVKAVWCA